MPCAVNLDQSGAVGAINAGASALVQSIITHCADFINNVMVPDALAIGQFNKAWSQIGTGLSDKCVLSCTAHFGRTNDFSQPKPVNAGTRWSMAILKNVMPVVLADPLADTGFVDHAQYRYRTIGWGVIL